MVTCFFSNDIISVQMNKYTCTFHHPSVLSLFFLSFFFYCVFLCFGIHYGYILTHILLEKCAVNVFKMLF